VVSGTTHTHKKKREESPYSGNGFPALKNWEENSKKNLRSSFPPTKEYKFGV
jgi:hypothetical protein